MFVGSGGKLLWVLMVGLFSLCCLGGAVLQTNEMINMKPVSMTLSKDVKKEYLQKSVDSGESIIRPSVVFTFEDGKTLESEDSRLNNYEARQLLAGKSVDVFYNKNYPLAVFDETEKPKPILWWIGFIISFPVFILAIRLWRQDYG